MQSRTKESEEAFNITKLTEEGEKIRKQEAEETVSNEAELSLEEVDLFDPEIVGLLVEKYGSYADLYRLLNSEQRQNLVDFLQLTNELRDHFGPLMEVEQDSDLRAFMLVRVLPNSLGISGGGDLLDTTDRELIAILDQPTKTEINPDEWIARMHLANLIDPEYALNWTRDAAVAYPEDLQTNFTASTFTLKIGATVDSVSSREREIAEDFLTTNLSGENAEKISSDDRISAYYGLFFSENQDKSLKFFKERLVNESDSKAKGILEGLISMMEQQNQ